MKNHLLRIKKKLPYHIDQLVSPFVNPRNGVVITGFWRSGTTWIEQRVAELLKAKTIFEPLEVDVRLKYHLEDELALPYRSVLYMKAHMPFVEDVIPHNTRLYHLLEDALRGKVPGKRVRINRNGVSDSLRRRVVVKHVRGQLAVHGLYKTFSTPILHIYRDPRSILASITRKDWGGEWMHQLSLRSQLLEPQDGRNAIFQEWSDDIDFFDQRPWWERAVAYWALTENYLRSCSNRYKFPMCFLRYEDFISGGPPVLVFALTKIGLSAVESSASRKMKESSPTTDEDRREATKEERLFGWKQELSTQMANRTLEIVHRFGCLFLTD